MAAYDTRPCVRIVFPDIDRPTPSCKRAAALSLLTLPIATRGIGHTSAITSRLTSTTACASSALSQAARIPRRVVSAVSILMAASLTCDRCPKNTSAFDTRVPRRPLPHVERRLPYALRNVVCPLLPLVMSDGVYGIG